jgi:uncharacterized membrane protein (UPF0127 family)
MELTLVRENGEVLCGRCAIADSPRTRLKGLLGRSNLAPDEGLLMATSAIHTCFMRFPIDLVFLDRDFVVTKTLDSVRPWRIAHQRGARSVVELAAGVASRAGVRPGEQFSLVRHGQRLVASGASNGDRDDHIRVALASADSTFLRVTRFLLARYAFEVDTYDDPASLLRDRRPRPDVVVLDSSTSLTVAARVMRELAVLSPTTAFVVVGDHRDHAPAETEAHALKILPKWDSFDRLVAEIRMASTGVRGERGLA